jgi:hypothetical protein
MALLLLFRVARNNGSSRVHVMCLFIHIRMASALCCGASFRGALAAQGGQRGSRLQFFGTSQLIQILSELINNKLITPQKNALTKSDISLADVWSLKIVLIEGDKIFHKFSISTYKI